MLYGKYKEFKCNEYMAIRLKVLDERENFQSYIYDIWHILYAYALQKVKLGFISSFSLSHQKMLAIPLRDIENVIF